MTGRHAFYLSSIFMKHLSMFVLCTSLLALPFQDVFGQVSSRSASLPTFVSAALVQPPASEADRAWAAVKQFGRPAEPPVAGQPKLTKADESAWYIEQASKLRAFYAQYPDHVSAKEAKLAEALVLNYAALAGDRTQDDRRRQLVDAVRRDSTLAPIKRFEVVAWAGQVEIARKGLHEHAAFLAAQEAVSWKLVEEFPGVAVGYESLLSICRDGAPSRAASIAQHLLAMEQAPPEVKLAARKALERTALLGQSIESILRTAGVSELMLHPVPKVTVLYSWSSRSSRVAANIKRLYKSARDVAFVGVCVDRDLSEAQRTATAADLPGNQWHAGTLSYDRVLRGLCIDSDCIVYLVDHQGVIRDLNGASGFVRKIQQLKR